VVAGHYHLNTLGQLNLTSNVHSAEVELGTIVVVERSVTATLLFLEDVNLSLEVIVGSYRTGLAEYHTTLNLVLVNTTEEKTDIVACFTLIEELAEHLDTGNDSLFVLTETEELNFVVNLYDTSLDTTGGNSTTTGDREDILDRHKEGLVKSTGRKLNPVINSIHELHYLLFPFGHTVEGTEGRTANKRGVILEAILSEEVTHFHLNEVKHFRIINLIALVDEHNETGYVYLTGQKDVLTSLGHGTISSSNYDDSAVHLCSTRNHVLHIVSVAGAVNVSIVTLCRLILNVCGVDCNTALLLFRSVIDLIEGFNLREALLCEHSSDSCGQGRLTVVNVADSTNVYVRFRTVKLFFCHNLIY